MSCSLTTQERNSEIIEIAHEKRKNAKICDYYPMCRVKKQDATLYKCGGCDVATYCSQEHSVLNWPAHKSLCKELQQRCAHPECDRRAEMRCIRCHVAAYCSKEHRSEHRAEHRSVCK